MVEVHHSPLQDYQRLAAVAVVAVVLCGHILRHLFQGLNLLQ
jgi:hypothetical protein